MNGEKRSELRMWAIVLGIGLLLVAAAVVFGLPLLQDFFTLIEPGMGIKDAAVWSFGVTFVMFLLFAMVAGDGLLGELQFMLLGFFLFFAIITLLIAWIF